MRSLSFVRRRHVLEARRLVFETCSCDVVCPCTASLSLGATKDRCKVTLVFRIKSGEVEGTDVSGSLLPPLPIRPR